MWVWRVQLKRMFFNLNMKNKKTWKKYNKSIDWYLLLKKKEQKEWLTKWLRKTYQKCNARLNRYWITTEQIKNAADKKWIVL